MKTRTGFVSNSSSSSFVVISEKEVTPLTYDTYKAEYKGAQFILGRDGKKTFGCENEIYDMFRDKINWAALQAVYQNSMGNGHYIGLINRALVKLGYKEEDIIWEYLIGDRKTFKAYIDHQSTFDESPENDKIFDSDDTLMRFLLNNDSYIRSGSDNE
jgi:hypothetical protein